MKYIKRDLKSNQKINRKYAKNYQHNMNIITFLKSNYKYKRRCTKCNSSGILQSKLPVPEEKNGITRSVSLFKTKFSKILRILILIMQQATPNINNSSILLTQLVVRMKLTKKQMKKNDAISYLASARDNDGISNNHRAYKDANEDTDTTVDISNISDEISHQQHNYDKVSTITSTPLRCQKQKHHQIKATKTSSSSSSCSSSSSLSLSLSLSSPASSLSIITSDVQANYETCQWPAILRHYLHGNLQNPQHHHHHQHAMHKKSAPAGNVSSDCSDNSTGTSISSAARIASICQSVDQYVSATWNSSYTLSGLLLTLFIAFTIGVRSTTAGACWQTVLDNGKCNEMFSLNISKSECCGANQEFAYTDREPTNVEYFFATAIGGGMECSPCLESCKNVKCGPNKKCVKRKGRPKCICAPECGAARRKRKHREHLMQQHHTFLMDASDAAGDRGDFGAMDGDSERESGATLSSSNTFKIKLEKSQQSRESRSLSSEITNINLGLEIDKDVANSRITSLVDRHHHREHNQNQRKLIHIHMHQQQTHQQQQMQQPKHRNQEPKGTRRLLITANVEHTEKPTTRRLQIVSNVRATHARRQKSNNNHNNNNDDEDTDPSDYDEDDYYGAVADAEAKKSSANTNTNNNRNDDATRCLNQSLSRQQLKTNTKPNNNSNKKKKNNNHDAHRTKMQQQHSNNNTNVRHPHHNGRHAENTPHHRHQHQHQHHHQLQYQHHHPQHNHQQQKQQQHNHHHQQHRHGRQKHKQQHKHPKNNTDYNTTMTTIVVSSTGTATASHNTLHNSSDADADAAATAIATASTASSTTIKNTVLNLSSPASVTTTKALPTLYTTIPDTQTLPKLLSSSTTPVNSSMSAANFTAAVVVVAADGYQNQHLLNRGSKIATSSSLSSSATLSAKAQSDSVFETTMSAKGEGVSHRHHQDLSEFTTKTNNNTNTNNDNRISTLNSYADKNQLLLQTQQEQQPEIPFFDDVVDQFDFHGFLNKQHNIKNVDNIRPTNPVCGTDGRTYNTECQLRKRACRTDNPNLHVSYRGHCKTSCNGVKCINGLTCVEDQYLMPHCIVCKIECPQDDYDNDVVDATRAVCGADGKTYKNTCDINRMICKIGRSIGVAYPGPCIEDQVTCDDINCGPKQVCLIDLMSHKPRCTTCRYKCSRKRRPSQQRFEEGKICGVNNRTYNSWCEMRKDSCTTGFHIAVKYPGDCH